MRPRAKRWIAAYPLVAAILGFLPFAIGGTAATLALGRGVPWIGLTVAAVVWACLSARPLLRARTPGS